MVGLGLQRGKETFKNNGWRHKREGGGRGEVGWAPTLARRGPREVRNRGLRPRRPRIPKTATPSRSHPQPEEAVKNFSARQTEAEGAAPRTSRP